MVSLKKKKIMPYIYIIPVFALLIFIFGASVVRVIYYSLVDWNGMTPTSRWNGFANFVEVFHNRSFANAVTNSLLVVVLVTVICTVLGILIAQMFYLGIRGTKFYRWLFYLPNVFPPLVVGIIFTFLLAKNGPLNNLLRTIGLGGLAVDWFADPKYALAGVMLVIIWASIGFAAFLFYGRLTQTSDSLFEAARLDGANEWQLIIHITIPQLKGTILMYLVLSVISLLSNQFPYISTLTNGGPGDVTTLFDYFIYLYTFKRFELGQGAAASVLLFLVTMIFSVFYLRLYNKSDA